MIFYIWLFGFIIFLWRDTPIILILILTFLAVTIRIFFILSQFVFLFFIWLLVYVGGIIIIFTYVVFFFKNIPREKKEILSSKLIFTFFLVILFSFIFIGGKFSLKLGGVDKLLRKTFHTSQLDFRRGFSYWENSFALSQGRFILFILVLILFILVLILFILIKKNQFQLKVIL